MEKENYGLMITFMANIHPKVYVNCMTYNQAGYILDALDGFCMQKTLFPYICGVVDDASTDNEQKVIRKYLEDYFSISEEDKADDYTRLFAQHKINKNCFFVVIFLRYNHYSIKKSKQTYISEWKKRAEYIAICEGDDYWIDPLKLKNK